MTLVVGNSLVKVGRGFLHFRVFGVEAHVHAESGQPFSHFDSEQSSMGTQIWAFGLTICASRADLKADGATWAD